jgi:hypothetical protein
MVPWTAKLMTVSLPGEVVFTSLIAARNEPGPELLTLVTWMNREETEVTGSVPDA